MPNPDPTKMVGEGRAPTPNRKYYRQPDETRLYTHMFVKDMKGERDKTVDKFLKYASHLVKKI
jgi:hypothetical protein